MDDFQSRPLAVDVLVIGAVAVVIDVVVVAVAVLVVVVADELVMLQLLL